MTPRPPIAPPIPDDERTPEPVTAPRPADLRRVVALVPVRTLETAKSRLGEPLDAEERATLVMAMLRRTVRAAVAARRIDAVVAVSPDPVLLAVASELGAEPVPQRTTGLNPALDEAREAARGLGATAILVLPTDLAAVEATELDRVLEDADAAAEPSRPLVTLVTDRHREGTNALLVSPPETIAFTFGEGSRARHAAAALAAGAAYRELEGPLSVDLDTADDLLLADASGFGLGPE